MMNLSSPTARESPTSSILAPPPVAATDPTEDLPPAKYASGTWRTVALIFLCSAVLALGTLALNGRYGLSLSDEGYLRYGVWAIMDAGQVPMRDFQSYDPARYYWGAAWSLLLGDGIVTTRLACSLFQVLGVGFALLALRRAGAKWWMLGVAGLLVTFWMVNRFKLFEQCVALIALYPAVHLIQRPDKRNAFLAGVFVGLAACMGRNHGFYNASAFGGLLVLLAWKYQRPTVLKLIAPWIGGIVLGYLPMLLTMAFVPGFFTAFVESLHILVRVKSTNLTIPIPWPWRIDLAGYESSFYFYCALACAWCFVLLAGGFTAVAVVLARLPGDRWRENAGFVAAGVVGIPYAHYAYSRADIPHLAHSMPLLLIAMLGLPALMRRRPDRSKVFAVVALGLGLLTLFTTWVYNPVVHRWAADDRQLVDVRIGTQTVRLNPEMAGFIGNLQRFAKTDLGPDENILIAPYLPTLYEVVGRLSPVEEVYFLWPQSAEEEGKAIRDLERKRVNWTLLEITGLDNMPERSFPATNPLLLKYLKENFQQVHRIPLPPHFVLLQRTHPLPATLP